MVAFTATCDALSIIPTGALARRWGIFLHTMASVSYSRRGREYQYALTGEDGVRLREVRDFVTTIEAQWSLEGVERPKPRKPNFKRQDGALLHSVQGATAWAVDELKVLLVKKSRLTEGQRERVWFLYGIAQMGIWACAPRARCPTSLNHTDPVLYQNGQSVIPL